MSYSPERQINIYPSVIAKRLNEMDDFLSIFVPANNNGDGLLKMVLTKFKEHQAVFQEYEKCDVDSVDDIFPVEVIFEMEESLFSDMKKWVEILPNIQCHYPESVFIRKKIVADMKEMLEQYNNKQ